MTEIRAKSRVRALLRLGSGFARVTWKDSCEKVG